MHGLRLNLTAPIVFRLGTGTGAGGSTGGTPTGDGTLDFSIATGDDTALLALFEDV